MAHFAKLNTNNLVEQVVVISNEKLKNILGMESEAKGAAFIQKLTDSEHVYKQTSFNATFRKNFAGIGYLFDKSRDAFIAPMPLMDENFDVTFDEKTCRWVVSKKEVNVMRSANTTTITVAQQPAPKIVTIVHNNQVLHFPTPRKKWWQRLWVYIKKLCGFNNA